MTLFEFVSKFHVNIVMSSIFFWKALQDSFFYQKTSNLNCSCKQSDLPSKISNSYKLLTYIWNGRSQTPNNLKFGRFVLIFKKSLIYNQVFHIYFVPFSLREKNSKKIVFHFDLLFDWEEFIFSSLNTAFTFLGDSTKFTSNDTQ